MSTALARLKREGRMLARSPVDGIRTLPNPSNVLEWHFALDGAAGTAYEGGRYHGILRFPCDFPYKPPAIYMCTPSGRFETNKSICLSMSEYHPESWNPVWTVASILRGLQSFMVEETPSTGTVQASTAERMELARASHAFNNGDPLYRELFGDLPPPPPLPSGDAARALLRRASSAGHSLEWTVKAPPAVMFALLLALSLTVAAGAMWLAGK